VAPDVAGSSPVTHPINFRACLSPSTPPNVAVLLGKAGLNCFWSDSSELADSDPIYIAGVVELVDTLDLGSSAVRCVGSSPSTRTIYLKNNLKMLPVAVLRLRETGR
jgi:hypothetical protein